MLSSVSSRQRAGKDYVLFKVFGKISELRRKHDLDKTDIGDLFVVYATRRLL